MMVRSRPYPDGPGPLGLCRKADIRKRGAGSFGLFWAPELALTYTQMFLASSMITIMKGHASHLGDKSGKSKAGKSGSRKS